MDGPQFPIIVECFSDDKNTETSVWVTTKIWISVHIQMSFMPEYIYIQKINPVMLFLFGLKLIVQIEGSLERDNIVQSLKIDYAWCWLNG